MPDKAEHRPVARSGAQQITSADTRVTTPTVSSNRQATRRAVSRALRSQPGRRAPLAPASVFPPGGRRTRWMFTYGCKICGAYSLGRAADIDGVAGVRRASCGHWVTIMIARCYGRPETAA